MKFPSLKKLITTRGEIRECFLDKSTVDEEIPCGRAVTTTWRFNGELVKQDIVIIPKPMIINITLGGTTA